MSTFKGGTLGLLIVFTIISCFRPIFPEQQILQHIGTLFIALLLLWDIKKKRLTNTAFLGIALFGLVHIIGARYIYSYVPYPEFLLKYFDFDINACLGWQRNHYDRLVHFSFGLFILPSLFEFIYSKYTRKIGFAFLVSWLLLQTFSLVYELFEWSLTLIMSDADAENYNGQQGDIWDAQKDMALAMLGSSISGFIYYLKIKLTNKK